MDILKTASVFTMRDQSSSPYAWIMEGSSPEALEYTLARGETVEDFVRSYVKSIIAAQYEYKASDATIYKVWRAQSGEFESICEYIRANFIQPATRFEVWFAIPAAYNAGEWRLSRRFFGPRGGIHWEQITHGIPATGGGQQMFLEPGRYKETWWTNGWSHTRFWDVTEDGTLLEG